MPKLQLRWINESIDRGVDPLVRAPIRQLTSSAMVSWGVYCEQIYSSADGRRIAFLRRPAGAPAAVETWVADLQSGEIARVGPSLSTLMASTPLMDSVYYVRPAGEGKSEGILVRLNLATLELDDAFHFKDCPLPLTPGVSSDERWFVSNHRLHDNVFGLYRVDLKSSRWEYFHEEKDLFNTHIQFEPSQGRDLLVQQNRGYQVGSQGASLKLADERGCALYVIDIDGKNQRFLPLGPPWTGLVDGHQCWIGRTRHILAAVDDDMPIGAQAIVAPGDASPQRIMPGFCFIHVCASADGRFLVADQGGSRYVYMGSLETGKVVHLCECPCSRSAGHHTWEEPYITPGNRHVIFNSERTGHAELYCATVPQHVLNYLTGGVPKRLGPA